MDVPMDDDIAVAAETTLLTTGAPSSYAPPSSSLSDPPTTDPTGPASQTSPTTATGKQASEYEPPQFSAQTEEILKRINANAATAAKAGTPGWEAAKEQIMRDMATSDKISTPEPRREASLPKRSARGGKRTASIANESADGDVKMDGDASSATPGSTGRGRGRGRGSGRGRGGGRGGKRKRDDRDEDEDGDSDSSEVITPVATMTKSGRSVQKPTAFVPPAQPSPTSSSNKRKRTYRKNPESAVCKVCLRGTSPASNMIVFCDGCNTPYHRFCHHPPIDQSVIVEVDKEWYCKPCEKERVVPVSEADIANFITASEAPMEQRQKYFASLSQGMLVTLLTKATTLRPDLPLFAPDFQAKGASNGAAAAQPAPNGHAHPPPAQPAVSAPAFTAPAAPPAQDQPTTAGASVDVAGTSFVDNLDEDENDGYEDHPPTYPRPGHGLMKTLPPEQEDLQWLVEDDDRFGVFSHLYQVDAQAANGALNGSGG
ncbi:hypothetical protein LTR36_008253 [Oleoguttula mirabilis]|uniref:PHD-type domain-containing protein n=1 Tax=Oleoguttula mirabilis TaxID=1507867 RepID=A0AAV9J8D5_9PEZI|nr:hypothetical protein LTR36_008253 [Oleoguttula mirabilis]